MGKIDKTAFKLIQKNKKAFFNYEIIEDLECGISLAGTEVKSIKHLRRKVDERGFTLVPTEIYLRGNLVKLKVALCRGKNVHDKKETIKERDQNRAMRRELKELQYR